MKKLISISFLLCCSLILMAQSGKPIIHPYTLMGGNMSGMSDNGLWAISTATTDDETGTGPSLIDLIEGKITTLPIEEGQDAGIALDVTDDGKTIVGQYQGLPAYYKNGTWTKLPMPSGTRGYTGQVQSVTPDGHIMVGMVFMGLTQQGVAWKDGELWELPNLPTIDGIGQDQHLQDLRKISSDGKQILGMLSYSYFHDGCCAFVYHTETATYDMIGFEVLQTPEYSPSFVYETTMSNNGRYISGMVHRIKQIEGSYFPEEYKIPFVYDVQTKKFTLYEEKADKDIAVFAIGNDGTLFASTPAENPERTLMVRSGNYWVDLDMILDQRYDVDFSATTGFSLTGFAMGVSDDAKTLAALSTSRLYCYSVILPETWAEAAKSINLLAECTVSPVAKSNLAKIEKVSVTFERAPTIKEGAQAFIYAGDARVATSTSIAAETEKTFTLTFPLTTFEAGKTYTVKIPAGCFTMPDSDMQNEEIEIVYTGREEAPVKMLSSNPADGDKVTALGYNNMLVMQFDTNLKTVSGKSGFLYLKDGKEAICPMNLVVNGSRLFAYPLTERKLMKGNEYRVCIQAGAVTDVTGYCPNDSITLNFTGRYQIDSRISFFDDFAAPTTSMAQYLLYDGDKRTPVAEMKGWEFDSENTPWNFSIRDDTLYNYCAASHSMYEPAGKSDDWMVLPSLNIQNEYYYLSFQAQSYKKNCKDSLKVYVLETNDALSVMNAEVAQRFRTEGKLIYKGEEKPGDKEKALAGEWTRHEMPLAEFSGKNIYIAFVNDNDNQSAVFLDSLMVEYRGNYVAANTTENIVAEQNSVTITGYVNVTGKDKTYHHLKAWYSTFDNTVSDTVEVKDMNLKYDDIYKFQFKKPLPLTIGKTTEYDLTVVLDGEEQTLASSVKCIAFIPTRRIVIEEGTGDWCGNCPMGIIALEYLEEHFPDRIIPVSIHNGDVYSFDAYNSFLGISTFPSGRVNRAETMSAPMYSTGEKDFSLTSPDGNVTWTDYTVKDLETYVEADIRLHDVRFDEDNEKVIMPVDVRFAVDMEDANYNLLTVVVEDSLVGNQHNYFANYTSEALGEWANNGKYANVYVTIQYKDVARAVVSTSFNGEGNLIPSNVKNNEAIENTITFDVPGSVSKLKNAKVICMLIDANTGKIVNADRSPIADAGDWSAIDEVSPKTKINIGTEGRCVTVDGSTQGVSVYTQQGIQVRNEALQKGIYIIRALLDDGSVYAGKVLIK